MDVSLLQYALVGAVAFVAATIGGIAGYGTGLLLPPVLVPLIGAEAVVPVIAVSALLTNGSRIAAFRDDMDLRRAATIIALALPTCVISAYFYTWLSGAGVSLLIGAVLILLVPLRRWLAYHRARLGGPAIAVAAAGFGALVGSTSGAGVVLISILLAAGLSGGAVIATDAAISLVLGFVKVLVFQSAGALPVSSWIMAAVIGVAAVPGAFIAKAMVTRLPGRLHTAILDAVVIVGGLSLVVQGVRGLSLA